MMHRAQQMLMYGVRGEGDFTAVLEYVREIRVNSREIYIFDSPPDPGKTLPGLKKHPGGLKNSPAV